MNKLLNISLCFILTLNFGYSQSIKRNVISSFGASSNTANSIVETTFGQPPNIGTITDGNNYVRQGFQQPLYNFIFTPGCTDSLAINYDANALIDDGSCLYNVSGCTAQLANNYNPYATIDDGTCLYSSFVFGCTDSTALNYNLLATVDDSSCCSSTGNVWSQIGLDIDGEAVGDWSGYYVSLSSDGNTVAIGAHKNDGNGLNAGHVRIFENIGGSWSQIGQDIDGEAAGDESGYSASLSSDGSIVAIGAINNDGNGSNSGHVRVFENLGSSWSQIGQDIDGEAAGDESGQTVSLSSDGNTLAIGAVSNDGNGTWSGHVRVYENFGGSWSQIGQDIDGEAAIDQSGHSISLSSDGSILAIGAQLNDGNGLNAGHVRIFENIGGSWSQIGQDIDGEAADDWSGYSASLSSDGSIVAIGATRNDGNGTNSGHVRVFQNLGSSWSQIGQDIDSEAAGDDIGYSVSLSSDGNTLAIGAVSNDGNGTDAGHVRIYHYNSSSWFQVGQDIDGEASGDRSGISVSLSSNGNTVAIGAFTNDGNGNDAGHVRIYSVDSPCLDLGCLDPLALNFDPNATVSDSTCVYPIYGCIDTSAVNYNVLANTDDGSCTYCTLSVNLPDTLSGCDSVQICTDTIVGGSYSWSSSNTSTSGNLAIGDFYQGGLIFYLDGNGGGLISAPSDQSTGAEWGCYGTNIPGADGTAIGTGAQNTVNIVNAGCGIAANLCANLTLGGYSDWFLPSKDELNEMYFSIFDGALGNVGNLSGLYWSSSEKDNSNAWGVYLQNGYSWGGGSKTNTLIVRAIRSFSSPNIDTSNCIWVSNSGWNYVTVTDSFGCIATDSVYVQIDICGCTDPTALNYNPNATSNDGSCIAFVYGCMDSTATNYNPLATVDDSSCVPIVYGCMDSTAINYAPTSNLDDGSCTYCTNDTSYTNITACDSVVWNDSTYTQSGTYSYSGGASNNYSMSFDGVDDYVDFGSNNLFFPSTDYTWQFDFVVRSHYYQTNSVQMHQPFINRSVGYNLDGYSMSYGNWGGSTQPNYYLWYGQGMNNIMQESWSSDSLITLNNWYNFTVVKSGDSIEIYLDGYNVTLSSTLSFDSLINNPTSMLLGATADILNICNVCPDSTFLDGLIDNLTLWNTALSDSDIQQYMNCPPTGSESGLVGYWNFEEGSGTTVYDQTANGNDGTINGATYNTNVPTQSCALTNTNGCDSTAILNLTINNPTSSYLSVSECEDYIWSVNNVTYSTSGLYIDSSLNTDGCTQVDSLDLIIYNATTSIDVQSACDSYTWNGVTYTSSGQHVYSTTNANGCDSIAILSLTINNATTSIDVQSACDSYTWIDGNTYIASNSFATYTLAGGNLYGCDSIITLNLTINQGDTSYTNITACDSVVWNGTTYTQSGTYSYSSTGSNNYSLDFSNQSDWLSIPSINTGNNFTSMG
jgi:hypothetical protein